VQVVGKYWKLLQFQWHCAVLLQIGLQDMFLKYWKTSKRTKQKEGNGMNDAQYWIDRLDLEPHVEGGYFKETYRADENIGSQALPERFSGNRSFCTAIFFLLHDRDFSAFHRIKQDELWHFYTGDTLLLHIINQQGIYSQIRLGMNFDDGEVFQAMVPKCSWFGANLKEPDSFTLVGCTVAPGFEFNDLEIANRDALVALFPEHRQIIERLTR
jgi:predicted cupin superfamily sugar epimerase